MGIPGIPGLVFQLDVCPGLRLAMLLKPDQEYQEYQEFSMFFGHVFINPTENHKDSWYSWYSWSVFPAGCLSWPGACCVAEARPGIPGIPGILNVFGHVFINPPKNLKNSLYSWSLWMTRNTRNTKYSQCFLETYSQIITLYCCCYSQSM